MLSMDRIYFPDPDLERLLAIDEESPSEIAWDHKFAEIEEKEERRIERKKEKIDRVVSYRRAMQMNFARSVKLNEQQKLIMTKPCSHNPRKEFSMFGFSVLRLYPNDWKSGVAIIPISYLFARNIRFINVFASRKSLSPTFQLEVTTLTGNLVQLTVRDGNQETVIDVVPKLYSINDVVTFDSLLLRLNSDTLDYFISHENLVPLVMHCALNIPLQNFYRETQKRINAAINSMKMASDIQIFKPDKDRDKCDMVIVHAGKDSDPKKTFVMMPAGHYSGLFFKAVDAYCRTNNICCSAEVMDLIQFVALSGREELIQFKCNYGR